MRPENEAYESHADPDEHRDPKSHRPDEHDTQPIQIPSSKFNVSETNLVPKRGLGSIEPKSFDQSIPIPELPEHIQLANRDLSMANSNVSDFTPHRVTPLVSLTTTLLGASLVFITAYLLGDQSPLYQLLIEGGTPHFLNKKTAQ